MFLWRTNRFYSIMIIIKHAPSKGVVLKANKQMQIKILSNGQNFKKHQRIYIHEFCKLDKISISTMVHLWG